MTVFWVELSPFLLPLSLAINMGDLKRVTRDIQENLTPAMAAVSINAVFPGEIM